MALTDRTTSDLVILILAASIGALAVLSGVGIILIELVRPEIDTSESVAAIRDVMTGVAGAVVGYLAGKRSAFDGPGKTGLGQ